MVYNMLCHVTCSKREAISILLAIDGERSIIPFGNFNLHVYKFVCSLLAFPFYIRHLFPFYINLHNQYHVIIFGIDSLIFKIQCHVASNFEIIK